MSDNLREALVRLSLLKLKVIQKSARFNIVQEEGDMEEVIIKSRLQHKER